MARNQLMLFTAREAQRVETGRMLTFGYAYLALEDAGMDTSLILSVLSMPGAAGNQVEPRERLREILGVMDYYTDLLLAAAVRADAAWHALVEPTHWQDVPRAQVIAAVEAALKTRAQWPRVDTLRVAFGREPTKPRPRNQATLDV